MGKRAAIVIAGVVVLTFFIYVGVAALRGDYTKAIELGAADLAVHNAGLAVADQLRASNAVSTVHFEFQSDILGDRQAHFTVTMDSSETSGDTGDVAELLRSAWASDGLPETAIRLQLTAADGSTIDQADFTMPASELKGDVDGWHDIRRATDLPVSLAIFEEKGTPLRRVSLGGDKAFILSFLAENYVTVQQLDGPAFDWVIPGVCGAGPLPSHDFIAMMDGLATVTSISDCKGVSSGIQVGTPGFERRTEIHTLFLAFTEDGEQLDVFDLHREEFASATRVVVDEASPNLNFGFFGGTSALRFYTGDCPEGSHSNPEPNDEELIAFLAAAGVELTEVAHLGQCYPR